MGAGSRLAGGLVLSVRAGSLAAGPMASFDPSFGLGFELYFAVFFLLSHIYKVFYFEIFC